MAAFETITVPKSSIVVPLGASIDEQIEFVVSTRMHRANYSQQMFEIADVPGPSPYQDTLNQIDAAIGRLKQLRAEMQRVASHSHRWDDNDYCSICGADGRA